MSLKSVFALNLFLKTNQTNRMARLLTTGHIGGGLNHTIAVNSQTNSRRLFSSNSTSSLDLCAAQGAQRHRHGHGLCTVMSSVGPMLMSGQTRAYSPSWGPPRAEVDRNEILARVVNALSKHEKIDKNQLNPQNSDACAQLSLQADLGLDSLDVVECLVHLEDEFSVEIDDLSAERMQTIQHLVDYLENHFRSAVDQNQRPDIEFKEGMSESRPIN